MVKLAAIRLAESAALLETKAMTELLEYDPLAQTGTYYLQNVWGDRFYVATYPCDNYYDLWDSFMIFARS